MGSERMSASESFESSAEAEAELTPEKARETEEGRLASFLKETGKSKLFAAAFLAMTAIGCGEKPSETSPRGFERGYNFSQQESIEKQAGPKTHIEKKKFSGYGIETEQEVEVDEDGNIVRIISTKSPYGEFKR